MSFRRPSVTVILGCMIAVQLFMLIPIFNGIHSSSSSTQHLSEEITKINSKIHALTQEVSAQHEITLKLEQERGNRQQGGSPVVSFNQSPPSPPLKQTGLKANKYSSPECERKAEEVMHLVRNTKAFDGRIEDVPENHRWRYDSKDLYWQTFDEQFCKFVHYNSTITKLPPSSVMNEVDRVVKILKGKGREKLAKMFEQCYPNTLSTTAHMLPDATVYAITGTCLV